jgi:mono/diheme cytochrome c family protein
VWHYKTTPHDGWNFDATMHIMVADLNIDGAQHHVVMTAPKNGFFYVLDAATGRFISAKNYTPVNWASGIDRNGRPIPIADASYWLKPDGKAIASPGPNGAHNWQAMAFNPATHLVYIPVIIMPALMELNPKAAVGGVTFNAYYSLDSGDPKWPAYGELVAWDPVTQHERWRARRALPINGGVLATGGNLVFEGTADGRFEALQANTGKVLWSSDLGESVMAAPSTVEVDGEQIVLVPAGNSASVVLGTYMAKYSSTSKTRGPSRLLAFKLGGTAVLPPTAPIMIAKPPRPKQPAELASRGAILFDQDFCVDCHGGHAEAAGGSIPDLRNASAQTHDTFEAIVMGGLRKEKGMPQFSDLSLQDVQAIHAYLINEAWRSYEAQSARGGSAPAPATRAP